MKNATLTTLTPVHIGSGEELKSKIEYLYDGQKIAVIDEKKVLEIIGKENIDHWVSIIQNNESESLLDYLYSCKNDFTIADVAKRIIEIPDEEDKSRHLSLKEQLHNGKSLPMIPGSSIKGAIRTALLTRLIIEQNNIHSTDLKNKKGKWTSQIIEKKLLGDTRSDPLRFLRISDAHFTPETLALNMKIMNFQRNGWEFKRGGNQLTEMIWGEDTATVKIGFQNELTKANQERGYISGDFPWLNDLPVLCDEINKHTSWLIDKELTFWKEQQYEHAAIDQYISFMEDIQKQLNEIEADKEMILRLGHGSGWNFITGGWTKYLENILNDHEYDELFDFLGKKDALMFPKTRKMDSIGELLGFIKISFG